MSRVISGLVIIDGTDDESWPFEDEHVHRQSSVHMVLDTNQPAAALDIPDVRWGGECRVETKLTAQIVGTGQVQIQGEASLFEGTDENSADLEDRKSVSVIVPKGGKPARSLLQLRSEGLGGGDHAEIQLFFTNNLYEEE